MAQLEYSTAPPELPNWLSFEPKEEPPARPPDTPSRLEVEQLVFESIFDSVMERLCNGESAKQIIESDPRQLSFGRFMRWIRSDPARRSTYEESQEIGTEALVSEIPAIADAMNNPLEDVNRSSLRISDRKWVAEKWNKKRYGEIKQIDLNNNMVIDIRSVLELRESRLNSLDYAPTNQPLVIENKPESE